MFNIESIGNPPSRLRTSAFTLAEVVVSVAISALVFGGIISANIHLTKRAEWTGQSLAAQALAIQQLEQARSAVWDNTLSKNEITNLNLFGWTYNQSTRVGKGYSYATLDLPISGTNVIRATNYVTITQLTNVTGVAAVTLQMVQVDTVWQFRAFKGTRLYTNTVATYYAPDNIDASNL
jgi:type II secretory pathway pseudopilin PulG